MKRGRREKDQRALLKKNLRSVLGVSGLRPHQREDRTTEFIELALRQTGIFYRLVDGTPLFFRHRDKKLYEISSSPNTPFVRHVTYMADLSVKANRKGFSLGQCLDRLRARVVEEAKIVHVHGLAFNSPEAEVVAVNDLGGGMWYRKRGGQWRKKPNGAHGILFWTPPDLVEPWTPEFSRDPAISDADHLQWLLDQAHFADDVLSARAQRMLWRALLLSRFFPSRNKTRPVPAHLGLGLEQRHDSGKTAFGKAIGIVLVGREFEPTPLGTTDKDKEALHLSLAQQPYVLLDNVDTRIPWLNDQLCTYATGGRLSRRKLYTDSTLLYYSPFALLCLTSRKANFTREDTASRTIPFRFSPITEVERRTEWELLEPVIARRGQIWAGLLSAVAWIQDALPSLHPPSPKVRLADFDTFGWCVAALFGEEKEWETTMGLLKTAQAGLALQEDPLYPVLREILTLGDVLEQRPSVFYIQVQEMARQLGLEMRIPRSAEACTTRLKELRRVFESALDASIVIRTLHGYSFIKIRGGPSWDSPGVTGVTPNPDS